jgi:hypothetical protein
MENLLHALDFAFLEVNHESEEPFHFIFIDKGVFELFLMIGSEFLRDENREIPVPD